MQNLNTVFGNNSNVMCYLNQNTPSKIKEIKNNISTTNNNTNNIYAENSKKNNKKTWSTSYDLQ